MRTSVSSRGPAPRSHSQTAVRHDRRLAISLAATAVIATIGASAALASATRLVEVHKRPGVYDVTRTWSAETGDLNGDGWDDLLVVNHYQKPSYLYRNNQNGSYTRISRDAFPERDRHDCSFGDANDDGLEDIYCSIGGGRGRGHSPKELWIQGPPGSFTNQAARYGVTDMNGRGRDNTFIDVDHDGDEDLYIGSKFPRTDGLKSMNRLFINVGGDHFRNAPEYDLNGQVGGKIVQRVDYNRDRWDDLLVCGERRVFLYRNARGSRFVEVGRHSHVDKPCESVVMAKLNRDARPDLAIVTNTRLKVMEQRRDRTFAVAYKRRLRGGTEVAAGQVNRDPLSDLYVVQRGAPDNDRADLMLMNRRGGRHFAAIDIPQTRRGKGDYVISLDHDRNRRSDFLVLNGYHKHPGPVRLLAARR
jgi:hypothetical protein